MCQRLISQIACLERRTARGGRDSIDHPPNGHDDLANVVAGVCVDVHEASRYITDLTLGRWRRRAVRSAATGTIGFNRYVMSGGV